MYELKKNWKGTCIYE